MISNRRYDVIENVEELSDDDDDELGFVVVVGGISTFKYPHCPFIGSVTDNWMILNKLVFKIV